ncbi:MAG: hypothetical protein AMJ84_09540 [Acidithiobacillales bacterium SM23_46]|nr:MAG: hypothetical protein AMJ84_09540 [Acidithiobacillales bacterium SM23_46]
MGGAIQTPTLAPLAYNGLRFSQFYNTAKYAQSRAALLSGLYHDEVGIGAKKKSGRNKKKSGEKRAVS